MSSNNTEKGMLGAFKDLRKLVEDFEEEMEILADKEEMEQIEENRKEKEKGNTRIFNDLKELENELES